MEAKFFSEKHPSTAQWTTGQSQSWKTLCRIKEEVDNKILWNLGAGDVSFSYDNLSNLGPLYLLLPDIQD